MAKATVWGYGPPLYPETVPPTGLTVTRSGYTFSVTWKIGDENYGEGQRFGCSVLYEIIDTFNPFTGKPIKGYKYDSAGSWNLATDATSKSFTVDRVRFPKIYAVSVVVTGIRSSYQKVFQETDDAIYYQSVYPLSSTSGIEFEVKPPNKAVSVTASLSTSNRCVFAWHYEPDDTAHEWYLGYEWDSVLVANSTVSDGSKITFKNAPGLSYMHGTGTAPQGEKYIEEDTTAQSFRTTITYTRWFRIRAYGPAGYSDYNYAKHVYARPNDAVISDGKATVLNGTSTLVWTKWTLATAENRPVDKVMVQYLIGAPNSGFVPPASGWNDAPGGEITDTAGTDGLTFIVPETVSTDQCLWTRVTALHDVADYSYSKARFMLAGPLASPSGLNVTVDSTTHKANIQATNNSSVSDSFLVVRYTDVVNYPQGVDIAVIPHGSTRVNNVQCPDWGTGNVSFSVYAVQGTYTSTTKAGVTIYTLTKKNMASAVVSDGGAVPLAPQNVVLGLTEIGNTINVRWDWSWAAATVAELSWADHEDAWTSTSGPSTYTVNSIQASSWNISGLDASKTWYVRVRLGAGTENTIYGPYSNTQSINISREQSVTQVFKPTLYLSKTIISPTESFTVFWDYDKTDGAEQISAEVALVTVDSENNLVYTNIAHAGAQQSIEINAEEQEWSNGGYFNLALRVSTDLRGLSEWSDPVGITVAEPLEVEITEDSLDHDQTIEIDGVEHVINVLSEMPLTLRVAGSGSGGTTTVQIVRTEDYRVRRPDDSLISGSEGEIVYSYTQLGEGLITITNGSLSGCLDDGAAYRLEVTVADTVGQKATTSVDFEVHWSHQAIKPTATVTMDTEHGAAILQPIAPAGTIASDRCDIYRLSSDKPELVYFNAEFGERYVDPSPTIGQSGGYRFVFTTENNDYITDSNELAWVDIKAGVDSLYNIISYDGGRATILYNVDLSSTWAKSFKKTQYLGGSLQGDWNPAVERTGSVTGVIVTANQNEIEEMRKLAIHPGVCRVRTVDGSNFAADVQVAESRGHEALDLVSTFTLTISKVDQQNQEGIKYSDWEYAE